MSLFDLQPIPPETIKKPYNGQCVLDQKGRTVRHRPWWELLGRGPERATCGDCQHLKVVRHSKRYFKCGRQMITSGCGTDIRKKDPACRLFQESA